MSIIYVFPLWKLICCKSIYIKWIKCCQIILHMNLMSKYAFLKLNVSFIELESPMLAPICSTLSKFFRLVFAMVICQGYFRNANVKLRVLPYLCKMACWTTTIWIEVREEVTCLTICSHKFTRYYVWIAFAVVLFYAYFIYLAYQCWCCRLILEKQLF